MNYFCHLITYFAIYSIIGMSLNLVVGYSGLLSMAQSTIYAVGGYTLAIISIKLGYGFIPTVLIGIVVAIIFSLTISIPTWKLRGDYFVLCSLGVQAVLFSILNNWTNTTAPIGTWQNLTNGSFGISDIPQPIILGIHFDTNVKLAFLAVLVAMVIGMVNLLLIKSPWGRLLKVLRDDDLVARGLGKNARIIRIVMIAISCGMVSVAGALYASYVGYIEPGMASLNESILMLSMIIVGGMGTFSGAIIGAIILLVIPELLRFIHIPDLISANIRQIIYGMMLIVLMHFRPQGIAGEYKLD